jgi:hypothetical protein
LGAILLSFFKLSFILFFQKKITGERTKKEIWAPLSSKKRISIINHHQRISALAPRVEVSRE